MQKEVEGQTHLCGLDEACIGIILGDETEGGEVGRCKGCHKSAGTWGLVSCLVGRHVCLSGRAAG